MSSLCVSWVVLVAVVLVAVVLVAVVLVAVVLVAVVLVALFDWAYKAGSIFITAVPVINASDIRLANTSSLGTFIVDYTCRSVYMHIVNVLMRIRSSDEECLGNNGSEIPTCGRIGHARKVYYSSSMNKM